MPEGKSLRNASQFLNDGAGGLCLLLDTFGIRLVLIGLDIAKPAAQLP